MIPISAQPKRFIAALSPKGRCFVRTAPFRPFSTSTTETKQPFSSLIPQQVHKVSSHYEVTSKPTFDVLRIPKTRGTTATASLKVKPTAVVSSQISETQAVNLVESVAVAQSAVDYLHGPRDATWWTGKAPNKEQPHSVPFLSLEKGICNRDTIQNYFDNTWTATESLFASLQGEEAFQRAPVHNLRHPLIFYYGHPAALYINKLRVAGLLTESINSYFEVIFETGVDEMSWDDMSKNKMPWPRVHEVKMYRQQVYNTITQLISSSSDEQCANINQDSPLWALVMSFEHERIHIETSSVLISELPTKYLQFPQNTQVPPYYPLATQVNDIPVEGIDYPKNEFITVAAQEVNLGKPTDTPSFGWDNEYGHRSYHIPTFAASKYKISNGEYYQFVIDGGYSKPEYWSTVGWKWRAFRNTKWPTFWENVGPQGMNQFQLRLLFDVVPMQWSWPVTVNLHESEAFAKWKASKTVNNNNTNKNSNSNNGNNSIRVMTELEHNAIRDDIQRNQDLVMNYQSTTTSSNNTSSMAEAIGVNSNLSYSSMNPVNAFPSNQKGFHDVFGNAWEWTIDYFSPLKDFKVHAYYEDFSTPCFDGLHHVIQGSSFMSSGNEASIYSRFHFRPHFHQHASFRLVQPLIQATPQSSSSSSSLDVDINTATENELVTSDTDAPGPYVGNYPFRQSKKSLQQSFLDHQSLNKSGGGIGSNSHHNHHHTINLLSKHYDSFYFPFMPKIDSINTNNNNNRQDGNLHHSNSYNNNTTMTYGYELMKELLIETYNKQQQNAQIKLPPLNQANVIDVGCGVGGLTFRLSPHVRYILGIDHELENIEQVQSISTKRSVEYQLKSYGKGIQTFTRSLDVFNHVNNNTMIATTTDDNNTEFRCADPMCLPSELHAFDIVIINDVLDKVASPNSILGRLGGARGLVKKGGLLVVASAYQWSEHRTPKSLWLTSTSSNINANTNNNSFDNNEGGVEALTSRISTDFDILYDTQVPMMWRESMSDFQGKLLHFTAFVRK